MAGQSVRIDSMKLAYEAFQRCRHACPDAPLSLEALDRVLGQARQNGGLVVEVPICWLNGLEPGTEGSMRCGDEVEVVPLGSLTSIGRQLLTLTELGARESSRLWASGQKGPLRSLGYAMHNIPDLVRSGDEFSRELYEFCFRSVAFHWTAYSLELRQAMCDLMGYDRNDAEHLLCEPGFKLDMFAGRGEGRELRMTDQW